MAVYKVLKRVEYYEEVLVHGAGSEEEAREAVMKGYGDVVCASYGALISPSGWFVEKVEEEKE